LLVVDQKDRPVDSLTADDLIVLENNQPQKIAHFQRGYGASIPRSIVLIIDYNCSQLPVLRRSIDAAKLMVDKLEPQDVMAIVTDDVELVADFTNDKVKLKRKLEEIYRRPFTIFDTTVVTDWNWHIRGKGLQLSALMVTLKEAFIHEDLRPIIVFQTNGSEFYELRDRIASGGPPPDIPDDLKAEELKRIELRARHVRDMGQSNFSLADIYRAVDRSRATIYTVIPEPRYLNRPSEEQIRLRRREVEDSYAMALAQSKLWG
jgi:VWFA-related protein